MLLSAFLIGLVAGSRSMLAPAAVSWAARLGWIDLASTSLALVGSRLTTPILTLFALSELVVDKLPTTPSRKMLPGFAARLLTGGVSGAAIGATGGATTMGLIAGALGAIVGTLGGSALRARMAKAFGRDLPAAVVEDVLAVALAYLAVSRV